MEALSLAATALDEKGNVLQEHAEQEKMQARKEEYRSYGQCAL